MVVSRSPRSVLVATVFGLTVLLLAASTAVAQPRPQGPPPQPFVLQEATIDDVHEAFDTGELTCRELVESYLERIDAYDQLGGQPINSIVAANDAALATAEALDEEFAAAGSTAHARSLHCVPVLVKDNYDTFDMPTTAGSLALENSVPPQDSFFVQRLREEGAIVLAKTAMAEFAWSAQQTVSSLTGETRNPYDRSFTTAGSSGGTGAATAANLGLVGLGTDTGNSVRGPSSHAALVGMRSTFGLTSRSGVVPLFLDRDIAGPMTRTVEDNAKIFTAVAGFDPRDPVTEAALGNTEEDYTAFLDEDALNGAVLGLWNQITFTNSSDPGVEALMLQAVQDLEAAGATVVDFEIDGLDSVRSGLGCNRFRFDMDNYLASLGPDRPFDDTMELVESGLYDDSIANSMRNSLNFTGDPEDPDDYCGNALERRRAYRDITIGLMDEQGIDALIFPTWANPPREIGTSTPTGNNSGNTAPQMGVPALTVPMGYTSEVLPSGLQFLGREFSEPMLFAFGYAYEQATQHRVPPADYPPLPGEPGTCPPGFSVRHNVGGRDLAGAAVESACAELRPEGSNGRLPPAGGRGRR